jgi:PAS domain S-box-containing protein
VVGRVLGYERDELIGLPMTSIVTPEELDATAVRLARRLDGPGPFSGVGRRRGDRLGGLLHEYYRAAA